MEMSQKKGYYCKENKTLNVMLKCLENKNCCFYFDVW